ncbi:MAG TPA: hypothetical protein VMW10_07375 [Alphaproteobacteria bacterium]|nr:hypothetical protein [Alphaproteobacteria bacterium]
MKNVSTFKKLGFPGFAMILTLIQPSMVMAIWSRTFCVTNKANISYHIAMHQDEEEYLPFLHPCNSEWRNSATFSKGDDKQHCLTFNADDNCKLIIYDVYVAFSDSGDTSICNGSFDRNHSTGDKQKLTQYYGKPNCQNNKYCCK